MDDQILNRKQLREYVPYNTRYLLVLEAAGEFPLRIKLGARKVGWSLREIQEWIAAKKAERDAS
jgi:prophage regulatory protein